jgi:hypothetical protein
VTGKLLPAAGEDGWWQWISLSLSESADCFNSIFWLRHKKFWWPPPVFENGCTPWDVGHFYFHQQHIASTMVLVIAPYDHSFYSNFEYFDQEEQSPKKSETCTR